MLAMSMAMTGYLGTYLPRFLALVRARRWLIVGIVVAAAALALVASLFQSSRYQAGADLLFGRTTNVDAIIAAGSTDTGVEPERAAATNLALASLDAVAAGVKRRVRGPATVDELRNAVSLTPEGQSDVVTVTAEWSTPEQAAAVANAFATEIVALRRQTAQADVQRAIDALKPTLAAAPAPGRPEDERTRTLRDRIAELEVLKAAQTGGVQLVERATPPQQRSSPTPVRNALIAGAVALILALFLVVLLARFEDRISDEDELAELMGATILSRIPDVSRSQRIRHIWAPNQDPAFLEAFEFLRMNLQLMGSTGGGLVIAVTSPTPGDGKTTVVAWLARSLALSEADVMAVDLDLRKPELHTYFDASGEAKDGVLAALLESQNEVDGGGQAPAPERDPEADSEEVRRHGRRTYSEDDITAGLVELARVRGNARRAARSLKAAGRDVSESTLRRWKESHAQVYAEMRAARIRGTVAAPHLRLLAGGTHRQPPTGMIAKERLQLLFDQLRLDTDYVLADTVPVSTVADASAVAAAADGVLLVVDRERARRRDLLAAKKQLANARAEVLGIVLNNSAVDSRTYVAPDEDRDLAPGPAARL
jgi:Mrp family chromosome partitioning ATPase